jgi:signal transduction histidine kinase
MADAQLDPIALLHQAFPDLNEADIQSLNQAAVLRAHPAGNVICHQGDIGATLYILAQGEVHIFVRTDGDNELLVGKANPGDYFGEMALFGKTTRAATIRANTDCCLLEIDQDTFLPIASQNPALLRAVVAQISDHLRNNDRSLIAELKQKNIALQAAYANLAEQERLRTEFIATLSHELRTPLTSAQGFLHLINKGAIKETALRPAMDSITRNVEKMVGLINNLLVLYEMHLISPQFSHIPLSDLVHDALDEAPAMCDDGGPPGVLELPPGLPLVRGDKNGLVLAIRSLIENAFKFSPENTPVILRGQSHNGRGLRLDVIDQGIGIPIESHGRIFEPFYRLEGSGASRLFPGLGVGLAIAKFIIDRHDGHIEVTSQPGHGSTFSVYLPTVKPSPNS